MSTEPEFKPPRKKPSIFWWLGGAFLVLVLVFLFQLLGPSPPITLSNRNAVSRSRASEWDLARG